MGIGDEVMVSGEVKRRAGAEHRVFAIFDKKGRQRWFDIWDHNPRIAKMGQRYDEGLINSGGARPYIAEKGNIAWVWLPYRPEPGEIFLTSEELSFAKFAEGRVVINPSLKPGASPNKQWAYWQKLVDKLPEIRWLQIGAGHEPRLRNVEFVPTAGFRQACGVLKGALGAVLQEGGLHHAAAALGRRSVVIYGGYISPASTGYDMHVNLFDPDPAHPLGCGMKTRCQHCVDAMARISVHRVKLALESLL
jgi:hypothetical protein